LFSLLIDEDSFIGAEIRNEVLSSFGFVKIVVFDEQCAIVFALSCCCGHCASGGLRRMVFVALTLALRIGIVVVAFLLVLAFALPTV
jgi:hypothetical protein